MAQVFLHRLLLAQLAELIIYNRLEAVCLSLCVSLFCVRVRVCVLTREAKILTETHCWAKKTAPLYFCNNFVKTFLQLNDYWYI